MTATPQDSNTQTPDQAAPGANTDASAPTEEQKRALFEAAKASKTEQVKELLEEAPTLITAADTEGNTLLHVAASTRNVELTNYLLEQKPELVSRRNDKGVSALDIINADTTQGSAKNFITGAIIAAQDKMKEANVLSSAHTGQENEPEGFFEKTAKSGLAWGLLGGILGLLLTGGGGIASFLIAGIVALAAAFIGPTIMSNIMGEETLPAHGLSNATIRRIDEVDSSPNALDGKVNLAAMAHVVGSGDMKHLLGADDFKKWGGLTDETARKAMEFVSQQTGVAPNEQGYIDVSKLPNPNIELPKPTPEKAPTAHR